MRYPVVYEHGHFGVRPPLGFRADTPTEDESKKAYQRNVAVREMEEWMKTTENPHYDGFFEYGVGRRLRHSAWSRWRTSLLPSALMAKQPRGGRTSAR